MASYNRGKGKGIAFVLANVNHVGADCLIWPFARVTLSSAQVNVLMKDDNFYARAVNALTVAQVDELTANDRTDIIYKRHFKKLKL